MAALGRGFVEANLERMSAGARASPRVRPAGGDRRVRRRPAPPVRPGRGVSTGSLGRRRGPGHAVERGRGDPGGGVARPDGRPSGIPPEVYTTELQNITGHPVIAVPAGGDRAPVGAVRRPAHRPPVRRRLVARPGGAWEAARPWPLHPPAYAPSRWPPAETQGIAGPGADGDPVSAGPDGLALLAGGLWGTSDFVGGTLSRRLRTLHVLCGSQAVSAVLALGLLGVPGLATADAAVGLVGGRRSDLGPRPWAPSTPRSRWGPWASSRRSRPPGRPCRSSSACWAASEPGSVALAGAVVALAGIVAAAGPELGRRVPPRARPRRRPRRRSPPSCSASRSSAWPGAARLGRRRPWSGMRVSALACTLLALAPHPPARPAPAPATGCPAAGTCPAWLLLGLLDVGATLAYAVAVARRPGQPGGGAGLVLPRGDRAAGPPAARGAAAPIQVCGRRGRAGRRGRDRALRRRLSGLGVRSGSDGRSELGRERPSISAFVDRLQHSVEPRPGALRAPGSADVAWSDPPAARRARGLHGDDDPGRPAASRATTCCSTASSTTPRTRPRRWSACCGSSAQPARTWASFLLPTALAVYGSGNVVWTIFVRPLDGPAVPVGRRRAVPGVLPAGLRRAAAARSAAAERVPSSLWLDGLVGGLAVGAVLSAPWRSGRSSSAGEGSWAAVATTAAYPLLDLILLLLADRHAVDAPLAPADRARGCSPPACCCSSSRTSSYLFATARGTYVLRRARRRRLGARRRRHGAAPRAGPTAPPA